MTRSTHYRDDTMKLGSDMHTEEFKIRLTPDDAVLLRALARRNQVPPAVILRMWAKQELEQSRYSMPVQGTNRRPA